MVDGSSFGTQLNGTIYASSDAANGRRPPHHRNSKVHGHNYHEVLRKRSMGLALAALILHEITPQHGGNCDYFSIKTRLTTLLSNTPLPKDDYFWCFAASLIIGIFRQRHLPFEVLPMTAQALAEKLLGQLPD